MGDEAVRDLFGKLGLDTTDLKTGLTAANRELRVLESGFRAASATMGDWAKSADGLTLRAQSLTRQIEVQQVKAGALRLEYERVAAEQGANSRAAQELQIKLNRETETLNKMQRELSKTNDALGEMASAADDAENSVQNLENAETDATQATKGLGSALSGLARAAVSGISGLKGLGSAAAGAAQSVKSAVGGVLEDVAAIGVGVATTLTTVALAGTVALVGFFGTTIGPASDLAETANKINTLFGESAVTINEFAADAAFSLGQSKQQALDAAATFATFGKAAGLTGGALVDFSTDLVSVASDFASFFNDTPKGAIEAITAALRGETEGVRKYGIMLDDATLRQKAFQLGITSSTTEALTPQQKTLAAYNLILEQGGAALGDFSRTSDGLANQQRILAAQWANLKAELGTGLLPAVQLVFQSLTGFLGSAEVRDGITTLSAGLAGLAQAFTSIVSEDTAGAYQGVAAAVSSLGKLFGLTSDQASAFGGEAGQAAMGVVAALKEGFDPKAGLLGNVQTFLARVGELSPVLEPLAGIISTVVGYVQEFIRVITTADGDMSKLGQGLGALVSNILKNMISGRGQIIALALDVLTGITTALVAAIPELLPVATQILTSLVQFITQALPQLARAAVDIITMLVKFLGDNFPLIADAAIQVILTLVNGIVPQLPMLIETALKMIITLATGLAEALPELIPTILTIIPQIVLILLENLPQLIDAALQIIIALIQGLAEALPMLIEYVPEIVRAFLDAFIELYPMLLDAAVDIVGVLITGIIEALPSVGEAAIDIVRQIIDACVDGGPGFSQAGRDIVSKIWDGISGSGSWLLENLSGFVQGIIDSAVAGFNGQDVGGVPTVERVGGAVDTAGIRAAAAAAGARSPTPGTSFGALPPQGQSSPTVIVNATVANDVDMYTLANRVADEMRKAR